VAVGLHRAATRKQLGQSERKLVDKAADYIDNNQKRLQYDQALALAYGLPIATGVIEDAWEERRKARERKRRAECTPGRTQDERGPPKAMAVA